MSPMSDYIKGTASAHLAQFAATFGSEPLPAAVRHIAYRALADTYACAIAGRHEPAVRIGARYVGLPMDAENAINREARGAGGVDPRPLAGALAWGTGVVLPVESAAWYNALAAHVLDFDDVMTPMRAHVSAVLVPALLALGQSLGGAIKGEDYARAYVAGFEVMGKFALTMALPHYTKGWHSTSALGIIGTTVACGVLLRLSAAQHVNALGLAVAQAAGTRANFGAMAKSFQAAQCASGAVRAALLAHAGFTASPQALDGRYGFMSLYAADEALGPALASLGRGSLEIEKIGIDVKKYPCCYALHRALDAVIGLAREHELSAERVASIDVLTSAGGLQALIPHLPEDGLQAKFSMPFAIASALLKRRATLADFTDANAVDPRYRDVMTRVNVVEAAGPILPRWTEVVLVERDSGRTFTRRVDVARGDAGDPLNDEELTQKVGDCLSYGGLARDARAFCQQLWTADSRSLNELIDG